MATTFTVTATQRAPGYNGVERYGVRALKDALAAAGMPTNRPYIDLAAAQAQGLNLTTVITVTSDSSGTWTFNAA
ncbi:hypothetical protein [Rhizobium leguminosarum]|uniref:hypothetical protein n=1 Tax=Rhizobium leguminosarum TaxID=384 RepID=UPI0004864BC6|nr:hypothetical protein [Rhizobium leguminosarum]